MFGVFICRGFITTCITELCRNLRLKCWPSGTGAATLLPSCDVLLKVSGPVAWVYINDNSQKKFSAKNCPTLSIFVVLDFDLTVETHSARNATMNTPMVTAKQFYRTTKNLPIGRRAREDSALFQDSN